jgi:hypothetical protein
MDKERGLANATWTMEQERLRYAMVLGMAVEHRFHQWPCQHPPRDGAAFFHRSHLLPPNLLYKERSRSETAPKTLKLLFKLGHFNFDLLIFGHLTKYFYLSIFSY